MRLLFLIPLFFLCAISSNAQKKLTLQANIGSGLYGFGKTQKVEYQQHDINQVTRYPVRPGGYAGFELVYLNPKWQLSVGVDYQYFQTKLENGVQFLDGLGNLKNELLQTVNQNLQALQIPLRYSFCIDKKNKLKIDVGFIAAWLKAANGLNSNLNFQFYEVDPNRMNNEEPLIPMSEHLEFLLSTGITFQAFKKIAFRLSFEHELAANRVIPNAHDIILTNGL